MKLENINIENIKAMNYHELDDLCKEIRKFLLKSVSTTGGHLASNFGVVELTVALHRIFNTPFDKIVFDVGHQSYVHKILTGRADRFDTLRKKGGLCGFPKTSESEHDSFNVGHSSTSISAATGMAVARDLKGENNNIVAVIGDGALTGGMAYEALNFIGNRNMRMIIILNDNEMSISRNVGAMDYHLSKMRTRRSYINIKKRMAKRLPEISKFLEKIKNSIKYTIFDSAIFEELGIKYIGPIDGHDIKSLESVLKQVKHFDRPVLVHVMTKKGQGYDKAQQMPERYHGVAPFNAERGIEESKKLNNSLIFANELVNEAKHNNRIVAITAAMPEGTGLGEFKEKYPTRFFDVGIAEQNAATIAAGMAINGLKPVFAVYSSFLQRAFDQVLHDICLQNLPVVLAVDRAGFVGEDGATHHGIYDIAYLSLIPNLTILSPSSTAELRAMAGFAFGFNGPIAIRYPRGILQEKEFTQEIKLGKWTKDKELASIVILATGRMIQTAEQVQKQLIRNAIDSTVINCRFIKPLDYDMLDEVAKRCSYVFCIEEGVSGGLGDRVASYLAQKESTLMVKCINILNDPIVEHGKVEELLEQSGLDVQSIYQEIISTLKTKAKTKPRLIKYE